MCVFKVERKIVLNVGMWLNNYVFIYYCIEVMFEVTEVIKFKVYRN